MVVDEWPFLIDGQPQALRVRAALICNDGAQARRWAVCGAGLALKSWVDVVDDLRAGRLEAVLEAWETRPVGLHLVSPPRRPEPRRVTVLKDMLAAHFQGLQ